MVFSVLVLEEHCGDGRRTFVAQTLEEDVATQVGPGQSIQDVVYALGMMWDARDRVAKQNSVVQMPPPAPAAYHDAWRNNSLRVGRMSLGHKRMADVRLLRDGYAIAIAGRKRPAVIKANEG
jgi:hypothetical protein